MRVTRLVSDAAEEVFIKKSKSHIATLSDTPMVSLLYWHRNENIVTRLESSNLYDVTIVIICLPSFAVRAANFLFYLREQL